MTSLSPNGDTAMIMAGGTGGHIFPGLAVAQALINQGWNVTWLGSQNGMEERLVTEHGINIDLISVAGLRGKGIMGWLKMPFTLSKAVFEARRNIKKRKPKVIIGFGGFVAGPGGIASKITATPLVIHEQNAIAGMTNKFLAKLAVRIFQAFPKAFENSSKVETVGNPIRAEIAKLHESENASLNSTIKVLIVGGSRGALALNKFIPLAVNELIAQGQIEIVHQVGKGRLEETRSFYQDAGIECRTSVELKEFITDMSEAFRQADLVICRAGASTVSEVAAAGKFALFVPFPYAVDDHQTANAKWLADADAAMIVQEDELKQENFKSKISELLNSPEKIRSGASKARSLAKLDAANKVADYCNQFRKQAA